MTKDTDPDLRHLYDEIKDIDTSHNCYIRAFMLLCICFAFLVLGGLVYLIYGV